jgi:hypothetical protein
MGAGPGLSAAVISRFGQIPLHLWGRTIKRSRFSQKQLKAILQEQDTRMATADVHLRHDVSSAIIRKWKTKFGGPDVFEAQRLWELERAITPS